MYAYMASYVSMYVATTILKYIEHGFYMDYTVVHSIYSRIAVCVPSKDPPSDEHATWAT